MQPGGKVQTKEHKKICQMVTTLLSEWVVPDSTSYYALSGRAPFVLAMRVVVSFKISFSL